MTYKPIRVQCKNNVVILCFNNVFDHEIDKYIVLIVEPDGEKFAVLDMRTFVSYEEALFYVDQEQTEHNRDEVGEADWYNKGGE